MAGLHTKKEDRKEWNLPQAFIFVQHLIDPLKEQIEL